MDREPWEQPGAPPVRPAGLPDFPSNDPWLQWVDREDGRPTRWVWAWFRGAWQRGRVTSEARDRAGWWFHVWLLGGPRWVHEAATLPWMPSPEQAEQEARAWGLPELPRDELIAQLRKDYGIES